LLGRQTGEGPLLVGPRWRTLLVADVQLDGGDGRARGLGGVLTDSGEWADAPFLGGFAPFLYEEVEGAVIKFMNCLVDTAI